MDKNIFILGGARSGKSQHALKLATERKNKKTAFIATCQPLDKEMERRIALHRRARPTHWQTFEEPCAVSALIEKIGNTYDVIVIDCLTLLLSNLLLKNFKERSIEREFDKIVSALKKIMAHSIVISNEVGLGIVPDNKLARDFWDMAGRVNQMVAKKADAAFFMMSGIPWRIK